MNKLNVAVLFGGESLEKEVSKITGLQVLKNIDKQKYNVYPIYIDKNCNWWYCPNCNSVQDIEGNKKHKISLLLGENCFYFNNFVKTKIKIHCAISCLHGGMGEDGTVFGMLKMCNIPISTSNLNSCNICLNKNLTKLILKQNGFNVLPYIVVQKKDRHISEKIQTFISSVNFPVVVKPIDMGSSIGVSFVKNQKQLDNALQNVFTLTNSAIIEKGINKVKEYNCSAIKTRDGIVVSDIEKPIKKHNILTYADKYGVKGLNKAGIKTTSKGFASLGREFPANISDKLIKQIKDTTLRAYKIFDCSGVIRCDYIYYNKKLYLNEINTIPGSLAYYLWQKTKYNNMTLLIDNLIDNAIFSFNKKR